jgi:AraC family transcriptional regulator
MTQNGFYGANIQKYLHLDHQPSSLITRSLRNAEIAVTEVWDDNPEEGPSVRWIFRMPILSA